MGIVQCSTNSHPSRLCTEKITCFGDSGGPLVKNSGKNATLLGVVSGHGGDCWLPNYETKYANVCVLREWIQKAKILTVLQTPNAKEAYCNYYDKAYNAYKEQFPDCSGIWDYQLLKDCVA